MKFLLAALALASAVIAAVSTVRFVWNAADLQPLDRALETRQSNGACRSENGDAPYSLSCGELASRIIEPNGPVGQKAGGVVFLVHGTGSQGDETWKNGPYNTILPNQG
jgi:hypothetical protein